MTEKLRAIQWITNQIYWNKNWNKLKRQTVIYGDDWGVTFVEFLDFLSTNLIRFHLAIIWLWANERIIKR